MKKILMVASKASHFGNFHIPYIKYLTEKGDKVYTSSADCFDLEGVVHFPADFRKKLISFGNIGVIFKLASLIRKEKIDAVYTNSTLAGVMGRTAAVLSGRREIKIRHICHGYLFNDDGGKKARVFLFFEKLLRKRTDLLAVMNKADFKIAKKYSLGKEIVFINGMGLDIKAFPALKAESAAKARADLGADENTLLFLCAAEFSPRKDQHTIIKALSILKRSDCKVVFAGSGELLESCRKLAAELGVEDRTVFLGHFENMNLLYRACDCLISAGEFEGLPFNVMEALYCGENVILSDVKGNRDLAESAAKSENAVEARESGRVGLFPFSNREALAELMERAVRPSERASRLAEKYFLENVFEENLSLLHMEKGE